MKQSLVITDLTQMPQGAQACVVGINPSGTCIRPVCENGFLKDYLFDHEGRVIIKPGAKIQVDLQNIKFNPPHIEDMSCNPDSISAEGTCDIKEWEQLLKKTSNETVAEIYDGLLQDNAWVLLGSKTKSIGTLIDAQIVDLQLTLNSIKPRIIFRDHAGVTFDRPSSDLALWDQCFSLVRKHGQDRKEVEKDLLHILKGVERLYLRLGLARAWNDDKCWLQITGVYTFPDYLNGKCFNDF